MRETRGERRAGEVRQAEGEVMQCINIDGEETQVEIKRVAK